MIEEIRQVITGAPVDDASILKELVTDFIKSKQYSMGQVMNALRIAVVGASIGPDLFEIIGMIGKDETIKRIDFAISFLSYI